MYIACISFSSIYFIFTSNILFIVFLLCTTPSEINEPAVFQYLCSWNANSSPNGIILFCSAEDSLA